MPSVTVGDTRIHYEVSGPPEGEPIVLIMGLGWSMIGWEPLLPYLEGFRVLRLDNRGAGESDSPDRPYSIAEMALDTIKVMNAVGIDSAHVYGASMGSMIAQELTLTYPARVRSLTLGCPSPGIVSWPGSPGILRLLLGRERQSSEEMFWRAAPYLFGRSLQEDPEKVRDVLRRRNSVPINPIGYRRQLQAISRWSSLTRLRGIRVPTLVVHGDRDRLIPLANGRLIARLIPGARLHVIRGAGHVYSADSPGESAEELLGFLGQVREVAAAS
jgi:pimeloyl-ACP methyl ester carboxylesterase